MITANIIGYAVKSEMVDMQVSIDTIKTVAENIGLSTSYLYAPSVKGAIIRAAKEIAKTNKRFKDHIARRVRDNDKFVISIVDEEKDADNDKLNYEMNTTIKYDKGSKAVEIDGPLSEEFHKEFEHFSNKMTTNDIRAYIYRILRNECGAIAIIPTGGLYFVPENKLEVVEKINAMLEELGIGRLWNKPEIDDPNTREWIWSAAIDEIMNSVDDIVKYINKNSKLREKTLRERGEQLIEKADLVKVYGNLTEVGSKTEEVMEKINRTINMVTEKIREVSAA